jgi:hypothetical protein
MSLDESSAGIWISFHIEDEEYLAFLHQTALQLCFNAADASKRALLHAYTANQSHIDSVARLKFLNGAARPIKLTVDDFSETGPAPETTPEKTSPSK